MNTQSQSMKGAQTFLLGMLAGASIVAAGLVLARGQHLVTSPAVMIESQAPAVTPAKPAVVPTNAELAPAIDLPPALVVGHRLKIVVRRQSESALSLGHASNSYV
jgi:hypothetical protein